VKIDTDLKNAFFYRRAISVFIFFSLSLMASRVEADKKEIIDKNYRKAAEEEIPERVYSIKQNIRSSSATVKVSMPEDKGSEPGSMLEMGLSTGAYRPAGYLNVPGLSEMDMSELSYRPIFGLHIDWLFLNIMEKEKNFILNTGPYISIHYCRHPVDSLSPGGSELKNTDVHTLVAVAGVGFDLHAERYKNLSAVLKTGVGRLSTLQSSSTPVANHYVSGAIYSLSALLKYRIFDMISLFVSYGYRSMLKKNNDEPAVQGNNFLVGIMGRAN